MSNPTLTTEQIEAKVIQVNQALEAAQKEDPEQIAEHFQDSTEIPLPRPKLTLRKPSELIAMEFDDSDNILGNRLFCKSQSLVIAGQGGIGKSRFIFQLIAAIVNGQKFLDFDTSSSALKWLVLQNENSNRRLHDDFIKIQDWLGPEGLKTFNDRVVVHCIEKDTDSFVSLDLMENQSRIADAIAEVLPDVIVIDPLASFAIGDLNKDADMQATLRTLSKICRKDNPERGIVVAHHALTGKGGAVKAVGYDRSSFARNSKALLAWARGQINLASVDDDNYSRVVVACGKCSNAKEFEPFAAKLDPDTMIYQSDSTVDIKAWSASMAGKRDEPLMNAAKVALLCLPFMPKADLVRAIREDCGCSTPSAYRYVAQAIAKKTIKQTKNHDTFCCA